MKITKNQIITLLLALTLLNLSCGSDADDGPGNVVDNFDRTGMLDHWLVSVILPAVRDYSGKVVDMNSAVEAFEVSADQTRLTELRAAWVEAYRGWQKVSMFEIGVAEAVSLRNFTNVFPANAAEIEENVAQGGYNLELPSTNDEQGFPALDYLINGLGTSDTEILAVYTDAGRATGYFKYLKDLTGRMTELNTRVLTYWSNGEDGFSSNSGSSATSSVNKLVNDYLFYYEKSLRAGKVGIPAGVFSGSPLSQNVEAFYQQDLSKTLLLDALGALQDFFNGKAFDSNSTGASLKAYLDFLNTIKGGEDLGTLINNQFNTASTAIEGLDNNFVTQIQNDNVKLLAAYDELQKLVILLKVDMLQALNIQVDFIDADGD